MAVATKVTGEPWSPETVAVVVCSPGVGPRIRVTEAWPSDPVFTVPDETLPPPCACQVTLTPGTALLLASVTATTSGLAKAVPTMPVWPLPPIEAMSVAVVGPTFEPQRRTLRARRPTMAQ